MTAAESAPRRMVRRRAGGVAVAVLALGAAFAVSGCGERFGPGSDTAATADPAPKEAPPLPAQSTPPQATPASTPPPSPVATTPIAAEPQLGGVENVGGVIWQPRALHDGQVQLSVRDGYIAAVVPASSDGVGQLRVSADGADLAPAEGAGPVPAWGRPHVGSDVTGRVVVTYPRCTDPEAVGTCDIYQWTEATGKERVLRGVSGTALAETEAVMDFGNVLVVREKRPVLSADDLLYDTPPLTTLLFKPRNRPLRVVTRHGGRDIDLRGSRVADVFVVREATGTACGIRAARALNLEGFTVARRNAPCSQGATFPVGPSVADNHLRFGIASIGKPGVAVDHDLATGRTREAKLTRPVDWWTADGERSGYSLDTTSGAGLCLPVKARREAGDSQARCRISRSAKLVWKPAGGTWAVKAGDTPVRD